MRRRLSHKRRNNRDADADKGKAVHQRTRRTPAHRPLIPFEMAFHSSLTLSRNAMIAMIAITTSTQVSEG